MDSCLSKHFIGPKLIRGVESRMPEYTRIEPPTETRAAGDNVAVPHRVLLFVGEHGTDDVLRTVKSLIVRVPGLKMNLFSTSAAAQKGGNTVIEKSDSSLDLGPISIRLTRLDNMDHLDLTITKERKKTQSSLCAIPGETS